MQKTSVLKLTEKVFVLNHAAPALPESVAAETLAPPVNAGSSLLLRRFLHRDLSPLLIVILLFLSPLTFSNEKIPNFQPDCATSFSVRAGPRYSIAITRAITPVVILPFSAALLALPCAAPLLANPPLYSVKTSRAPPRI